MRVLGSRHEIVLFSLADETLAPEALAEVGRFCRIGGVVRIRRRSAAFSLARALFDGRPFQQAYYASSKFTRLLGKAEIPHSFDAVHASTARVLPYLKRTGIDPTQVVIDLTDAQSLGLRSRRDRMHFPARLLYDLELARIEHSERALARNFPHVVVTSEADRQELGSETVSIIRNGVDLTRFPYADTERDERRIVMTGNMGYQPNIDGALWFAERVWPRIRGRYPNARWSVVGARPALALRSLDGQDGIEVLGQVEDLGAHLRHATIAIAPILCGAGIQNKVLEAFASGTPVVATSFANEGVQAKHGEHLLIADEPEAFAAAIATLFADPAMRFSLASRAHRFVEETLTWEAHALQLEQLYSSIAANPKVR